MSKKNPNLQNKNIFDYIQYVKENENFFEKIRNVKSSVNHNCPETFSYSHNHQKFNKHSNKIGKYQ